MDFPTIVAGTVLGFGCGCLFGGRGIVIFTVLWMLFVSLSLNDEHAEVTHDRTVYCKMVEAWHQDAKLGIAPEDRGGWPPFDGECND